MIGNFPVDVLIYAELTKIQVEIVEWLSYV